MSITWTIVDPAGAGLLAETGFASYFDFINRQPGHEVGKGGTTRTTRLRIGSEPRTHVREKAISEPISPVMGPEASAASEQVAPLKAHAPSAPPTGVGGSVFFIKVYRYVGSQWRHRFRRDKASLEAANYELLDEIGIGTPQVVAFGARRSGLRLLDAVIVTRGLPDVISLDRLFELRWPDAEDHAANALRREVVDRVVREVRRMHDAEFFHIDLQWRNILIGGLGDNGIDVYFLDAPRGGLRTSPWAREHGRLRDLSCLYKEARRRLSRTEQLRWLLIYLGETRVTPATRAMIQALLFDRTVKDNE